MIELNNNKYELIENARDGYDEEALRSKFTDYFDNFDYIVGDWAYGKLRLKGFNVKGNKNFKSINDYKKVDKYLEEYCAYGCKYFIIKRVNVD